MEIEKQPISQWKQTDNGTWELVEIYKIRDVYVTHYTVPNEVNDIRFWDRVQDAEICALECSKKWNHVWVTANGMTLRRR